MHCACVLMVIGQEWGKSTWSREGQKISRRKHRTLPSLTTQIRETKSNSNVGLPCSMVSPSSLVLSWARAFSCRQKGCWMALERWVLLFFVLFSREFISWEFPVTVSCDPNWTASLARLWQACLHVVCLEVDRLARKPTYMYCIITALALASTVAYVVLLDIKPYGSSTINPKNSFTQTLGI